jgi:peptidyl-prolyl cis-trans isomerase C
MIVSKKKGQFLFIITAFFFIFVIAEGCGSKEEKAANTAKAGTAPSQENNAAPGLSAPPEQASVPAKVADAARVAVEVEGSKLTQGELEAEMQEKMAQIKNQIPAESIENARTEMRKGLIDGFIARTLLNREISNRKITVTEKEIADVIAKIKSQLPAGETMDELLKKNKIDAAKMREEIGLNIRINKLIMKELGGKGKPTKKEIAEFYEKNRDKFTKPESVHARHILVAKAPEDTEKIKADKKTKAEEMRKQLIAGADFADMAAKNSDDPNKQNGGDLGFFSRGQMVKPFEDAAFSQKNSEIGPVVETDFGFHIIQILEHRSEQIIKLEGETEKRIGAFLEQRKKQVAFDELVNKLRKGANIVVYGN